MAEKQEKTEKEIKKQKEVKQQTDKPRGDPRKEEERNEILVRIFGYDIPGSRNLFTGLTRIKGVSWAISNAACIKLSLNKAKKISELTKPEIAQIENFLKNLDVPDFLKNRRLDSESGKTSHFYGADLDMKREFDIKRLKEIKSYKGIRHALKLPVRGQRTRSHFRKKGAAGGIKKKNDKKE